LRHKIIVKHATLIGLFATEAWFLWNPNGWVFEWEPIVSFVGLFGAYVSLDIKRREKDRKETVQNPIMEMPGKGNQVEEKVLPHLESVEKKDIQLKSSNISLEEYFQRRKALEDRFLEKTEFIESLNGSHVSWKATVESVDSGYAEKTTLTLMSLSADLFAAIFAHLPPEFKTKAFSLRKGDKVIVEGILDLSAPMSPRIEADSLNVFTS